MTRFEGQLEDRLRAFAKSGVRSVDSVAVARAVALGRPWITGTGRAARWLGLTSDRRTWAVAAALGLLALLLGGAILVGAGLLRLPPDLRLTHLVYFLDGDIYVADWDGENAIRIVDGDSDGECRDLVEDGLVSPDGRHIAYYSNWGDGCQSELTIRDLAGHLVASFPGWGWDIAWSPDGTRIATWLADGDQMIGVYGIDGTRQAVLDGSRMCCGDYDPVWSPDGSASIIVKESGTSGPVWELPIDGSAPRRVPEDDPRMSMAYLLRPPAYSPDGTRAAWIVPWKTSLVVSAADGTQRRVLVEADSSPTLIRDQGLVWSASGDRIAYIRSSDTGHDAAGNVTLVTSELWVVDTRTRATTMLATARGAEAIRPLSFSPDGDRIVFFQADERGDRSLWSTYTDGSGAPLRRVSGDQAGTFPGPGSLEAHGIAPDGDRILVGDDDGRRSLWWVKTDGGSARMLVEGTNVGRWVTLPADVEDAVTP